MSRSPTVQGESYRVEPGCVREMLKRIIDSFRKSNAQLNRRLFKDEENTYRRYLRLIDQHLSLGQVIVDLGSGSVCLQDLLPRAGEASALLIAVDRHYDGLVGNRTHTKIVSEAASLPFDDETLDLIVASCFFEHVENPDEILSECYRVLKRGAALVFYTPNRRSYVAAIARITPLTFHRFIRRLQTGMSSDEIEVCQKEYKMNTPAAVASHKGEFCVFSLETYVGAPCYTTFLPPPLHLIFILFHKILQSRSWLRRSFGESIIGCLVKPGAQ